MAHHFFLLFLMIVNCTVYYAQCTFTYNIKDNKQFLKLNINTSGYLVVQPPFAYEPSSLLYLPVPLF